MAVDIRSLLAEDRALAFNIAQPAWERLRGLAYRFRESDDDVKIDAQCT